MTQAGAGFSPVCPLLRTHPANVRADTVAGINSNWDALRKASPGMSETSFLRLASSRQGADHIVAALNRSNVRVGTSIPFVSHWRQAEDAVAGLFDVSARQRQLYRQAPGFTPGRYADMIDDEGFMREVKSGFVPFRSRVLRQIEKDAAILADNMGQNEEVLGVVWHFVGGRTGSLGTDPRVLDLLDSKRIPYVIHLP